MYIRHGSSTSEATPDEIAEMGEKLRETLAATFEVETKITIRKHMTLFEIWAEASLLNNGNATAYDVKINISSKHQGNRQINHMLWKDKPASRSSYAQSSLEPLHQGDKQHIFSWPLGIVGLDQHQTIMLGYGQQIKLTKPVKYTGEDIEIQLEIFTRDLAPASILISYSKEEIEHLTEKTFLAYANMILYSNQRWSFP